MGILTKDQILAADDAGVIRVEVEEWGGEVCIRVMSSKEADAVAEASRTEDSEFERARLAAALICDESGALLFSVDDIGDLEKKSHMALDRVIEAGLELNGLTSDAVDGLEKNLETGPSDDSDSS